MLDFLDVVVSTTAQLYLLHMLLLLVIIISATLLPSTYISKTVKNPPTFA